MFAPISRRVEGEDAKTVEQHEAEAGGKLAGEARESATQGSY